MTRHAVLMFSTLALFASGTAIAATCPNPASDRPKVGLVLGGGGARGIAHIGVIRLLEELRIPVDYVAGTSMGALVGGMYATGLTADELETVVTGIDWQDIFADGTTRAERPYRRKRDDDLSLFGPKFGVGKDSQLLPQGAISGQKIRFLFEKVTSQRVPTDDFDELPIPYRAVAADVVTGDAVVIGDGDMSTAMRASMSIPGLFRPIERGDALLVDGGISKNLPVDVVQGMGADVIIAVDVGTPLSPREDLKNFVGITGQLSSILIQRNTTEQKQLLTARDVLIVPALGDEITSADFDKATDEAIPIGYAAAEAVRDRLAQLSVDQATYAAYRQRLDGCVPGPPTIQFVHLDNQSRFADSVINERLHVRTGQPLDTARLETDLQQVFALGFIDTATYDVVEENGQHGIVVHVRQDTRGTTFIETGLDLVGGPGSSSIDLRLGILKTDVGAKGGEFRATTQVGQNQGIFTELYAPLDDDLRLILLPRASASRRYVNAFDDEGRKLAKTEVEQWGGALAIGREFWRHAAVFAGVSFYEGDLDVDTGEPIVDESFKAGEYFTTATWDRLDDRYFPSTGTTVNVEYRWSDAALGADTNYDQLDTVVITARTFGRHTILGGLRYGTTFGGDAPIHALFQAGGPFRLSGLEPDELTGKHYGVGLLGYRLRLVEEGLLPPYVGATFEYGNAADERDDIVDEGIFNGSLYVGFDSPLGPLYAGYGMAEGGRRAYFLRIGSLVGGPSPLSR